MSDLISRKAVMEELLSIQDVTYMSTCLTVDECKGKRWMIARAIDAVKDAPTIDAEPVVRCRDCKYSNTDHALSVKRTWCDYWGTDPDFDDFCSCGERKGGAKMDEVSE